MPLKALWVWCQHYVRKEESAFARGEARGLGEAGHLGMRTLDGKDEKGWRVVCLREEDGF